MTISAVSCNLIRESGVCPPRAAPMQQPAIGEQIDEYHRAGENELDLLGKARRVAA